MSMFDELARMTGTAIKLPFAAAWDAISLGNMGEGSSTARVLQEHQERKQQAEDLALLRAFAELKRELDR